MIKECRSARLMAPFRKLQGAGGLNINNPEKMRRKTHLMAVSTRLVGGGRSEPTQRTCANWLQVATDARLADSTHKHSTVETKDSTRQRRVETARRCAFLP